LFLKILKNNLDKIVDYSLRYLVDTIIVILSYNQMILVKL